MLEVRLQSWNLRSAVLVSLRSSKAECISLSSPSQEDPSSSPKMTSDSRRLFKLGSLWTCSLWGDMAMVGSIIIACNTAKKRCYQRKHEKRLWVFVTIRVKQADTTIVMKSFLGARLRSWVTNCVSWEPRAWYQIYTQNSPAAQWSRLYVWLVCSACWLCIFLLYSFESTMAAWWIAKNKILTPSAPSHARINCLRLEKYGKYYRRFVNDKISLWNLNLWPVRKRQREKSTATIITSAAAHTFFVVSLLFLKTDDATTSAAGRRAAYRTKHNVGNRQPPTSLVFFFSEKTSPRNDFLFAPFRFPFVIKNFSLPRTWGIITFTVSSVFCLVSIAFRFCSFSFRNGGGVTADRSGLLNDGSDSSGEIFASHPHKRGKGHRFLSKPPGWREG